MIGMSDPGQRTSPSRRSGLSRSLACLAILLLLFAWQGSRRVSAGAAAGVSLAGARPLWRGETLRAATFNIHGGRGLDGRRDLSRTAACLSGFDVIGLNEVRGGLPGGSADQAQLLGTDLGQGWLFAPAERRWWRDDFGNGLLCAAPVTAWQRIPLPGGRSADRRNALVARVAAGKWPLTVLVTHLTRSADRPRQISEVARLFRALPAPALLLGDLNTTPADPALRPLLAGDVRDPLRGRLGASETQRLDWILTRGLRVLAAGQRADGASDHPCLWAEVRLED